MSWRRARRSIRNRWRGVRCDQFSPVPGCVPRVRGRSGEALTIILAAGTARDWRSSITGLLAGMATLAAVVAPLGPALSAIPLDGLRLFVGGLLLVFGLQWLRKAILRASGHKALHDEAMVFEATLAAARQGRRSAPRHGGRLVRLHVVVQGRPARGPGSRIHRADLRRQSAQHSIGRRRRGRRRTGGSLVGFAVRAPLSRVPENSMKFAVGVMLIAFGMFWAAEGAGAHWPLDDAALLVLVPAVTLYALALVALFRDAPHRFAGQRRRGNHRGSDTFMIRKFRAFGAFWYDFIVGDDWLVALGVCSRWRYVAGAATDAPVWWIIVVAVAILLPLSVFRATRHRR